MKVIITGSEGFIGSALSLALQKRGIEVIGIDRKNGQEAADIAKYMPDDLDAVFHLAAQTSVFNTDLIQIRKDNIDSFMAVVEACANHPNKPKLVYASSSTANPPNTTSLYGITKHFAEEYARIYLPSATGARLHNVYGPNPRQGTLLWCLMNQDRVTIYNDGRNVRHFTYIDDVVEGLLYAYGCHLPLINIANPEEASVLNYALGLDTALHEARMLNIGGDIGMHAILNLVPEIREKDRFEQAIDTQIPIVPLDYTSVHDGLLKVAIDFYKGKLSKDN
ncbi:MAG: SDR family oxidoreductase [Lachnospiraceae bacterium]|nr:SDR family oxidoreductase [Lachnospiraceae bacterium]